ncbi:hypothetical protein [Nonomuraea sp. NPDC001023]|uniref:hypothetical protein n=1 Tax=unclassified Nonomuraea TaxID=2593643 RepID=UPI0033286088
MGHGKRSLNRADVTTELAMTLDAAGAAVPYRHRRAAGRYGPLVGHLRAHGFDAGLLRRAMDAAGVPDARRRPVLEALR